MTFLRIGQPRSSRWPKWWRVANYLRWRFARTPVLLNARTWELMYFSTIPHAVPGEWRLRRPLTLPESTNRVFLDARIHLR